MADMDPLIGVTDIPDGATIPFMDSAATLVMDTTERLIPTTHRTRITVVDWVAYQ